MAPNELIKVNIEITRNGMTLLLWNRFRYAQLKNAMNGSRSDQLEIICSVKLLAKEKIRCTLPIEVKRKLPNNWTGFIDWSEILPFIVTAINRPFDHGYEILDVPSQRLIDITEQKVYPR